ncbi:PIN domain-containing protein [Kluyvera sichuanensis]|uniref:PIN domain-containing protein n=1 Tax=Kluyvera sichuanensis TaxID=2725494 RepID=UPI002FD1FCE4
MELQTRLVFIDTSAYEQKKLQFGHYALARLEEMVREEKIHLLVTDVVHQEIESHLKRFATDAVTQLRKFQKTATFLQVADEAAGGGLFREVTFEAVLAEATRKFHRLVNNGFTETVSVASINPTRIFDAYFRGAPPFHRDAKKSEFPDAFSLAAIDDLARARGHKVYVVSSDGDMAAVAADNDHFIHLPGIDELLDLVNRNDAELAELSVFADSVLESLKPDILLQARTKLSDGEFSASAWEGEDPEIGDIHITGLEFTTLQLIEVSRDGATYDIEFRVALNVTYDFTDYSHANYDREDGVHYGVEHSSHLYAYDEYYSATVEISFAEGLRQNAEIVDLNFDESIFDLDLDEGRHIQELFPGDAGEVR